MKYFDYLYSVGYSFLCCVITVQTYCPQPDVPANGKYVPKQNNFELGDEVTYSCKKGFALYGKKRRVCKSNGMWSDPTPFCDCSTKLSNPSVTSKGVHLSLVPRVIDGNPSTCFEWYNATGEYMYLHFDNEMVMRIVNIFLKKGFTEFQIFSGVDNDMKLCTNFKNFIETDRWITVNCNNNVLADTLKILVIGGNKFISVCEVEVYGKDGDGCDYPPDRIIPNGHFEVSRSKATLICDHGYKSKNNRLACEGNSTWSGAGLRCDEILCDPIVSAGLRGGAWTFPGATKLSAGTTGKLVCTEGYQKKGSDTVICQHNGNWTKTNATCEEERNFKQTTRFIFGAVGILVVLLIIALLATTIHFIRKQRNKEVVVVYQPQSDGSVPLSVSEMEYSVPHYDSVPEYIPSKAPEPPSTPRPTLTSSSSSGMEYTPSEQLRNTLKNKAVPPDLTTFGSMKSSTIYGS